MNRILVSLFLLLFPYFAISQSLLTVYLEAGDSESLDGIIVSLHESALSKKFLSYAISDSKGIAKLQYQGDIAGKVVRVRSLMYRDTSIVLAQNQNSCRIRLHQQIQQLKEVQVRSTPIIKKGDTLTYFTAAFAQKRDFSIGEVIKRMPGFDELESGKITYQGREIEKYYIEGADLLEERYALANKNLPHKAVASVDVMLNHQSKKIFENRIASDQTSINIKLKKSVAITGRGEIGTAYKPWGRFINLTPMMFSKKLQWIASLQSNDLGDDLSDQNRILSFKNGELVGKEKMRNQFLGLPSLVYPKVNKRRYLDNNANSISLNALRNINDKTELKINSGYLGDRIHEARNTNTDYYLDDALYSTHESYENNFRNQSLYANLNLKKNLESIYLNNKVGYIQYWDRASAIVREDSIQNIRAKTPHRSLYNVFDCSVPIGKSFASIYSSIDLNESDEDLLFSPSVFHDILGYGADISVQRQNLYNRSLISENHFKFDKKWKQILIESKIGLNYETQELKTGMYSDKERLNYSGLSNNIDWSRINYLFEPTLRYETQNNKISLSLPLDYYSLRYHDYEYNGKIRKEQLLFEPHLYLYHKWNSSLESRINLRQSTFLSDPNQMLMGNVIYDHRSMRSRVAQIDEQNRAFYSLNLSYSDAINGLFAKIGYNYSNTQKDFIVDKTVLAPGVFQYQLKEQENNMRQQNWSSEFSLYMSDLHLNFSLKADYSLQKSNYLLNESLKQLNTNMLTNTFKLNFDKWNFLALDYSYSISHLNQKSNTYSSQSTEQLHHARICYYFSSRRWLELRPEYSRLSQSGNTTQKAVFTDLYYSYRPKGSRFSYLIECRNIFNSKYVYSSYGSDLSYVYNEFELRPRAIVAKLRFSFGKNK